MPEVGETRIHIRVKNPDLFVKGSFRTISISAKKGIWAVIGRLRSDPSGGSVVQKYTFDVKKWTLKEAQAWVNAHEKKSLQYIMQLALSEIFCE